MSERLLKDGSATWSLDPNTQYTVRTGRLAFGLLRGFGGLLRIVEGHSPELDEFILGDGKPYNSRVRDGGLVVLSPGESVEIGRRHGVQVVKEDGSVDEDRGRAFCDEAFLQVIEGDETLSRRHTIITALGSPFVKVRDANSRNGTFVPLIPEV